VKDKPKTFTLIEAWRSSRPGNILACPRYIIIGKEEDFKTVYLRIKRKKSLMETILQLKEHHSESSQHDYWLLMSFWHVEKRQRKLKGKMGRSSSEKYYSLNEYINEILPENIPIKNNFTKHWSRVKMWVVVDKDKYFIEYCDNYPVNNLPDQNLFAKYGVDDDKVARPYGNCWVAEVDRKTCIKIAMDVNKPAAKEIFKKV
jgi:hypothetical protein